MDSKSFGPIFIYLTNDLQAAGAALRKGRLIDGMKSKSFGWLFIYWADYLRLINLKPALQKWREIMAQIILRDLCFAANLENHVECINSYVKSFRFNA
jgi:hypothetical protein